MASASSAGRGIIPVKVNAAVEIEVDQVAVRRRANDAGKHADAFRVLAARHAPDQLVDDAVKAPVVVERRPGLPVTAISAPPESKR